MPRVVRLDTVDTFYFDSVTYFSLIVELLKSRLLPFKSNIELSEGISMESSG